MLVLGANGATGKAVLKRLKDTNNKFNVFALARKPKPEGFNGTWIQQDNMIPVPDIKPDHIMCCLGTTKKTAGSAEKFIKIDHDLVIELATAFHKQNPNATLSYISSMSADANSSFLYTKSKGRTENDLMAIGFKRCYVLRPGFLVLDGKRPDERWLESAFIFLIKIIPFKDLLSVSVDKVAKCMIKLAEDQPEQVIYENSHIHKMTK